MLLVSIGKMFEKGLRVGTGQCNVKRYNRQLRDLIIAGRAKPSFVVSHELPLDQAPGGVREVRQAGRGLHQGHPQTGRRLTPHHSSSEREGGTIPATGRPPAPRDQRFFRTSPVTADLPGRGRRRHQKVGGGDGDPIRTASDDAERHRSGHPEQGVDRPGPGNREDRAGQGGSRRQDGGHDPDSAGSAGLRALGPGAAARRGARTELINDDQNTHCALLPSNGDRQFIWLVNHSKGTATLSLDGPGYYWYSSPTGNDEGRGLTGAIVVMGETPPEARLDRPTSPGRRTAARGRHDRAKEQDMTDTANHMLTRGTPSATRRSR